jgi:Ran GTPase-activating protein (RanGAP) involved in mRNA processing and transport
MQDQMPADFADFADFGHELELEDAELGPAEARVLGGLLATFPALTTLDLSENSLGEEGGEAVADALRASATLAELTLERSGLGHEGMGAMAAGVAHSTSLTKLELCGNELGVEGGKAVAGALRASSSLVELGLCSCRLCGVWYRTAGGVRYQQGTHTAEAIVALADALRLNSSLTAIELRNNTLRLEGGKAIAEGLAASASLTSANLLYNELDPESARSLATIAQEKGISLCGIAAEDTEADFSAQLNAPHDIILLTSDLAVRTALTELRVSANKLGDEGAVAIGAALAANEAISLAALGLYDNKIGPDGAKALAAALPGRLSSLDLRRNAIGSEGEAALREAVRHREGFELRLEAGVFYGAEGRGAGGHDA